MTVSGSGAVLREGGALRLLVRAASALPSDFGEAMPVLFEVPVDPPRLAAWIHVLDAVAGAELLRLFHPFLLRDPADSAIAVEVRGVAGAFLALRAVEEADALFGQVPGAGQPRARLRAGSHPSSRLDMETREVRLHVSGGSLQWAADLTDVEEQVTLRTPRLEAVDLVEMQLQMCPPQVQPELFHKLVLLDPRRASILLSLGVPDPWSPDPSARRPLEALPMRVLLPLLRHADAEVRSRAARALDLSSGP